MMNGYTLSKIKMNSQQDSFLVIVDNQEIGFISKFKKQKGYNMPWQGFLLDGKIGKPNTLTGSFYGSRAKEKAIKSILDKSVC
jgi:hypothetical protein